MNSAILRLRVHPAVGTHPRCDSAGLLQIPLPIPSPSRQNPMTDQLIFLSYNLSIVSSTSALFPIIPLIILKVYVGQGSSPLKQTRV